MIVLRGIGIEETGFIAKRKMRSSPVEIPPRMPPALLLKNWSLPFLICIWSLFSLPRLVATAKPEPTSTPLVAGIDIRALQISASSLSKAGSPIASGGFFTLISIIAPIESPSLKRIFSTSLSISLAAFGSAQRNSFFSI